jgi:excisionase family DNA binding protein
VAAQRLRFLNVEELAGWLGVEVVFVRRLIAERRVPFVKIGRFVRFDPEEIAAWIDGQRVATEGRSRRVHRKN